MKLSLQRTRRLLAASALAGCLTLAACGGDDSSTATTSGTETTAAAASSQASAPSPDEAEFNDADVAFAQEMTAHHEQAIEMAQIAQDPTHEASAEVVDLATRIEAAQDPEIQTMTGWLTTRGQPSEMAGHDMSSMPGAMSEDDMASLSESTGPDFDQHWLTMMIEHHEGAIEMASAIQSEGVNPDVRTLAEMIVSTQEAEVTEMGELLDS